MPRRGPSGDHSGGGIELEGHVLKAVEVGHTDTDDTTGLWVPSIRLFVAGDSVYNHCHQYLNESGAGGLEAWYRALDIIEALDPKYAVAGHKDKTQPDDGGAVQRTRTYLKTFERLTLAHVPRRTFLIQPSRPREQD